MTLITLESCKKAGVTYTVETGEGMCHCYPMLDIFPEDKAAREQMRRYIRRYFEKEKRMTVTIVLSIVLMVSMFLMILTAVSLVQSKKLFTTAPKDVQAAIFDRPERFPGARLIGWVLLVFCVLAFVGAFVYGGYNGIQNGYNFWRFFVRFLTMLYLEKAFDIVFFDWFLLTRSHFFQHFYPETEGCEGYQRFGFNRREQIAHILAYPFLALIMAGICTIL